MEQMKTDKRLVWLGRVLSAVPALMLLASGAMKLTHNPQLAKMFVEHFGYPESALQPIGAVELGCAIIYLIPQTAVLGAILMTGYLGGAVATHVRAGEGFDKFAVPLLLGILAWAGLYFRDHRLRALLPLRAPSSP